jgi:hypothetical protein
MRSSFRLGKPKSAAQAVDSRPCSGIGRVALDVTGDADRGVPEQVSDRFDVHTGLKLGHGRAVPQCVHADVLNTGLTVCNLDRSQDVARLDRPPNSVVNTRPESCHWLPPVDMTPDMSNAKPKVAGSEIA